MQSTFWATDPFSFLLQQFVAAGTTFLVPGSSAAITAASLAGPPEDRHEAYGLYVPPTAQDSPALVVMLHGGGQDHEDFAKGTGMNAVAARHGFIVLYPEQSTRANPARCWNWFDPAHQSRDMGEPARLAALTLDVAKRCLVDPARVYVAGLSAGGAMAAVLGELFPEIFAAVGVHSGLPARAASDLGSALNAMRCGSDWKGTPSDVPTIVFHGDQDETVSPINALRTIEASLGIDHPYECSEHICPSGRRATRRMYVRKGGRAWGELWSLHGTSHAWSGGNVQGSFADPQGPDASEEMWRFFDEHPRRSGRI